MTSTVTGDKIAETVRHDRDYKTLAKNPTIKHGICEWCGDLMFWPAWLESQRYCGHKCANEGANYPKRKLPRDAVLIRHYVTEQMSCHTIAKLYGTHHKTVLKALDRAGVERRPHTSTTRCIVPGCGKPVVKRIMRRRQKQIGYLKNGGWRPRRVFTLTGRRCAEHQYLHDGRRLHA